MDRKTGGSSLFQRDIAPHPAASAQPLMQAALVRVLADDTFIYTPHQTLINRLFMALGDSNSFLGV